MPDGSTLPGWPRALREDLAAAYVGLSATTFRQVVAPAVPAILLSTGRIAWRRDHLDAWIESRPTRNGVVDSAPPAADAAPPPEPAHARSPVAAALANLPPARGARRHGKTR